MSVADLTERRAPEVECSGGRSNARRATLLDSSQPATARWRRREVGTDQPVKSMAIDDDDAFAFNAEPTLARVGIANITCLGGAGGRPWAPSP